MVICPISVAVGCQKCFLFKLCPLKRTLGNFRKGGLDRRSSVLSSAYWNSINKKSDNDDYRDAIESIDFSNISDAPTKLALEKILVAIKSIKETARVERRLREDRRLSLRR